MSRLSQSQNIFDRFNQKHPNPQTELVYHSAFELLVAVMLSAQTTDKLVNKVTQPLFQIANTPKALLSLGESGLSTYVRSINYYRTKTRHILKTAFLLIQRHHGIVPNNRTDLESLPGVGRKSANVILNVIYGHPVIAVDTHIFRVSHRIGLATGSTPYLVEQGLMKIIPPQHQRHAHHWLVLHGRYICKARQPLCHLCLIRDLCDQNI